MNKSGHTLPVDPRADVKTIRVLIPSAGAGPAVAAIKLLRAQKSVPVRILALDMDPAAAGLFLAHEHEVCPSVRGRGFGSWLVRYAKRKRPHFVIPILDLDVAFFGRHRADIEHKTGMKVLGEDFATFERCNHKLRAFDHCRKNGIVVPRVYPHGEAMRRSFRRFPVIVKPVRGIGSRGVRVVRSHREWSCLPMLPRQMIVQAYIPGTEFTIDTLSDSGGRCLVSVPRERIRVRDGQIVKGRTSSRSSLVSYGKRVVELFGIRGPACVQCKVHGGKIHFIEINPRYGTGVSLSGAAGVNIPLLHLKLARGLKIKPSELSFKGGCVMSRYWEEIYLNRKGK